VDFMLDEADAMNPKDFQSKLVPEPAQNAQKQPMFIYLLSVLE